MSYVLLHVPTTLERYGYRRDSTYVSIQTIGPQQSLISTPHPLIKTPSMHWSQKDVNRAVVLMRGRWEENPTSLVGHSAYTLVASFSPAIYYKAAPPVNSAPATVSNGSAKASGGDAAASTASGSAPKSGHQVVAVAGQDRVVTVWLAAANRPVAILREVFDKPPSDLSWGADGYTLLVSGHDGTVVFLRFTDEELGTLLPEVKCGSFVLVSRLTSDDSNLSQRWIFSHEKLKVLVNIFEAYSCRGNALYRGRKVWNFASF